MLIFFTVLFISSLAYAWFSYSIILQTWDLVDSGKHLDWGGSSKYQTQFNNAVNTWNNYKSGVIRKDTLTTVQDVTITDVNKKNVKWAGQTDAFPRVIRLNKYYLDNYSNDRRQNCCVHELGHALRLEHRDKEPDSVMRSANTPIKVLSLGDKRNYDAAYKQY